ncbi:uncharacterized protein Tco_1516437 [Tanacetum coccineum]
MEGIRTRDAATGTYFKMKATLLWTINDFPARSSLSGWNGQGYLTCPTCNVDTPSSRVRGKITYVGHRRFLHVCHHWRMNKRFDGKNKDRPIPKSLTNAEIMEQLSRFPRRVLGKHSSIKHKKPNRKNVLESLLGTLLMMDKSKDTLKGRQDLEDTEIRPELWLTSKGNRKFEKPHPKYYFKPEDRKKFCQFIKGVKLPDGFGSNFKKKVTTNDNNITGMKSHEYLCQNFDGAGHGECYRPTDKYYVLFGANISSCFFDIMVHLVIHLPKEAIQGGPIKFRWMYPFERYMKKLTNYVRNKARPEGSIAEGYVAEEALNFCSRYLKNVETRFNRLDINEI